MPARPSRPLSSARRRQVYASSSMRRSLQGWHRGCLLEHSPHRSDAAALVSDRLFAPVSVMWRGCGAPGCTLETKAASPLETKAASPLETKAASPLPDRASTFPVSVSVSVSFSMFVSVSRFSFYLSLPRFLSPALSPNPPLISLSPSLSPTPDPAAQTNAASPLRRRLLLPLCRPFIGALHQGG